MLPEVLDQAVADLTPTFAAIADDLAAAGAKLDPAKPLDVDSAVRDDTTKELKTAQAAVDILGLFAGVHVNQQVRNVAPALASVLPVVSLPDCSIEVRAQSFATVPPTLNEAELAGTHAVRELGRALERDVDAALVGIACGRFPGVTLALANRTELRRRVGNAARANTRRSAQPGQAVHA